MVISQIQTFIEEKVQLVHISSLSKSFALHVVYIIYYWMYVNYVLWGLDCYFDTM